ncbi:hypothetical protein LINGRAHAP2_LOCUS35825 [Linum grandiflorum]
MVSELTVTTGGKISQFLQKLIEYMQLILLAMDSQISQIPVDSGMSHFTHFRPGLPK